MPFMYGSGASHDDSQHNGSAKRNTASGVAALDSSGNVLAVGSAVKLVRTGGDNVFITETTSGDSALRIHRTAANDYEYYGKDGGADSQIQIASMKDAASGIAGLDASSLLALAQQRLNFFVGTFTRDMTAAGGNVAYAGVGFQPRLVVFFGGVASSVRFTILGVCDGTNNYCTNLVTGPVPSLQAANCIYLEESAGKSQGAVLQAFGADGFTLTWTKTGVTAAGTATMFYIAVR